MQQGAIRAYGIALYGIEFMAGTAYGRFPATLPPRGEGTFYRPEFVAEVLYSCASHKFWGI